MRPKQLRGAKQRLKDLREQKERSRKHRSEEAGFAISDRRLRSLAAVEKA